jgi:type II secretion system protein G
MLKTKLKKSNQKGFTLIELLVVISVLGVLFAILLPNMIGVRLRARDTQKKNDLRQLKAALRLYYNDFQIYPDSSNGAILGCGPVGDIACPNDDGSFAAGDNVYMKELMAEDDFVYEQAVGGDDFLLYSILENPSDADIAASVEHCNVAAAEEGAFYICAD